MFNHSCSVPFNRHLRYLLKSACPTNNRNLQVWQEISFLEYKVSAAGLFSWVRTRVLVFPWIHTHGRKGIGASVTHMSRHNPFSSENVSPNNPCFISSENWRPEVYWNTRERHRCFTWKAKLRSFSQGSFEKLRNLCWRFWCRWGGEYFLIRGEWRCAARWGRIFTTGLTIMGSHFQ